MGPLTTHSAENPAPTDQASGESPGLQIRPPSLADGAAMWRVARDSGTLDLNTSYAYLLMARDFATTSRLAVQDGTGVGFVLGYLRPTAPETLFVWQIAVDATQRGKQVAGRMLDALLEDLPQIRRLETTITEDNTASRRLFASFASRHGASEEITELITEEHFPDAGHGAELLHTISPLHDGG